MITKYIQERKLKKLLLELNIKHRMIMICIVENHFASLNSGISIFGLRGEAILPNFEEGKLTKAKYDEIIEYHTPLLIYNHLAISSYPSLNDADAILDNLEVNLNKLQKNPWVEILLKAFHNGEPVTKQSLLNIEIDQAAKLEISRGIFTSTCTNELLKYQKLCRNKENSKKIKDWLKTKSKEVE
ncbi:hypothetical protein [Pseudoalteromonas prydzensis]|uniref:hypothetical protein n=1 Tax=Pseudoalteromonas prydzensis TaxID=182141 RepID=UPI003FD59613